MLNNLDDNLKLVCYIKYIQNFSTVKKFIQTVSEGILEKVSDC